MTVIDVQVFNSSHTETPEQRTRTHAEAQYACMHSIVVHMQVVMYLHNYAYKLYISLSLPRKHNEEKKKNKDNREFVHTAAGAVWSATTIALFQYDKNNKPITVTV